MAETRNRRSSWEWDFEHRQARLRSDRGYCRDSSERCATAGPVTQRSQRGRPSARCRRSTAISYGGRAEEAPRRRTGRLYLPTLGANQPARQHAGKVGVSLRDQLRHFRRKVSGVACAAYRACSLASHRSRSGNNLCGFAGTSDSISQFRNFLAPFGVSDRRADRK